MVRKVYSVKLKSSLSFYQGRCCTNPSLASSLFLDSKISEYAITWIVLKYTASGSIQRVRTDHSSIGLYLTLSSSTEHTCIKSAVLLVLPESWSGFANRFISFDDFCTSSNWLLQSECFLHTLGNALAICSQ